MGAKIGPDVEFGAGAGTPAVAGEDSDGTVGTGWEDLWEWSKASRSAMIWRRLWAQRQNAAMIMAKLSAMMNPHSTRTPVHNPNVSTSLTKAAVPLMNVCNAGSQGVFLEIFL